MSDSQRAGNEPPPTTTASGNSGSRAPVPPPPAKVHYEVRNYQVWDLLNVLLALRFINGLFLRTFFQPDEYFQALEPAWRLAFGPDSGAWLTWEWEHQLRSSLHPVLFGLFYRVMHEAMSFMSYFPAFQALLLPALSRLLQSSFAGLGDFYTWRLAEKLYGVESSASWAALWMTLLSPWQWYCSTRTFSNSLETTLTIVALYHWPWEMFSDAAKNKEKLFAKSSEIRSLRASLLLAALAVVLRPTNLLIWLAIATIGITRLTLEGKSALDRQALLVLAREAILCGSSVLAVSAACDRWYYGEWTFPAYKWLYFNISQSLAVFYGQNPWHYYVLQGIPLLATTYLPFVMAGLFRSISPAPSTDVQQSNALKALSFSVLSTVACLSLVSHKEVRFIYPLLPILHVLAAPSVASFFSAAASSSETATAAAAPQPATTTPTTRLARKPLLALLILINLLLGGYLSLFHQSAPLSVTSHLRYEFERLHPDRLGFSGAPNGSGRPHPGSTVPPRTGDELFAVFLTPCHSTPWRSHLGHAGLRARALTCEPPLGTGPGSVERAAYRDEADRFYDKDDDGTWGVGFLAREMWPVAGWRGHLAEDRAEEIPRFIVGFEGIEPVLTSFFSGPGKGLGVRVTRVWEGWNGFFNEDWRRQGKLVVWDTGVYSSETPVAVDADLLAHREL